MAKQAPRLADQKFEVVDTRLARLDGSVSLVRLPDGSRAYLKTGTSFGRQELLDEVANLQMLRDTSLVPEVLGVEDDGVIARAMLSEVPGRPLHELVPVVGGAGVIDVAANVLKWLWGKFDRAGVDLADSAAREVRSLPLVINDPHFSVEEFTVHSGGRGPAEILSVLRRKLETVDLDVFAHGDLCLPNIMVVPDTREWRLIDLGKAGLGDRFRDLASLKSSLDRNVGEAAYPALLDRLDLVDDAEKRSTYDMIDWFWYAWG
jgi:aminoglycoside phosphotransferase